MPTLEQVIEALKASWGRDTMYPGSAPFDSDNPAKGQCAVTALVLQHFFGGEITRARMSNRSTHYYNQFANGMVDLTWEQFGRGVHIKSTELILTNINKGHTKERFDLLLGRVVAYLDEQF